MSELHHKEVIEPELNLGDILRELFRWKWHIAALVLLAGIIAAFMALRMPNKYASQAALIIRQPEGPLSGEVQPLAVETLKKLTDSADVRWALFDKLWRDQALAKWKKASLDKMSEFRDFQGSLDSELIKEESRGSGGSVSLLPVLELNATARSPEEAQTIANEWVEIVTSRSQTIYMKGIQDLDVFIGDVYLRANDNLMDKEELLATQTSDADLDLKQAKFDTVRNKVLEFESDLFDLDVEIRTNESLLTQITQRLKEREYEGTWLGDSAKGLYIEGKQDVIDVENAPPVAKRILQNVKSLVEKNEELQELTTSSRLEAKTSEVAALQGNLVQATNEISGKRVALFQSEQELQNIEKSLAEQEVNGVWIGELLSQYYRQATNLPPGTASDSVPASTETIGGTTPATAAASTETAPDAASLAAAPEGAPASQQSPAPQASVIPKPPLNEQTQRIDATVSDLIQRELDLMKYQQETDIDFKKMQIAFVEGQLGNTLTVQEVARKGLVLGETRLAYLKPELSSQPPTLSLDKAITDDVLWQEFLTGTENKAITIPLKTEVLNPIYQRAQDLVMDLTAETESYKEEIEFLAKRESDLRTQADVLRTETSLITMEIQNRQRGIDAQRSVLDVMAKAYSGDKEKRETLILANRQMHEEIEALEMGRDAIHDEYREMEEEIAKIRARIDAKSSIISLLQSNLEMMANDYQAEQAQLETLYLTQVRAQAERDLKSEILKDATDESETLQEDVVQIEQSLKLVNREIEKLNGVRSTLATRAEEVALLTLTAEKASRSGVVVLYNAQLDPLKVAPARTKIVGTSMLGAFVFSCVAVFLVKALRTDY